MVIHEQNILRTESEFGPLTVAFLRMWKHPAANATLPTLTQKSTGCRPPRRKKGKPRFQMTKIHQGNSADISTLHEAESTKQITRTDCNFHDQSIKHRAPNQQPLPTKNLLLHNLQKIFLLPLFFLRPKFLREFFRDKISQLEARLIKKKMALSPNLWALNSKSILLSPIPSLSFFGATAGGNCLPSCQALDITTCRLVCLLATVPRILPLIS